MRTESEGDAGMSGCTDSQAAIDSNRQRMRQKAPRPHGTGSRLASQPLIRHATSADTAEPLQ